MSPFSHLLVWWIVATVVAVAGGGELRAETPESASGTESGALHGVVFGPERSAPLQGVEVRVDGSRAAETNRDGGFVVELPTGTHEVVLEAPDGPRVTVEDVPIRFGETTEVIVELRRDEPARTDIEAPERVDESERQRAGSSGEHESDAEPGTVRGTVRSKEGGTAVEGARVLVRGVDRGAETDAEGTFELRLPPGDHDVSVVHPEYSALSRTGVSVESGEATELSLELRPAAVRLSAHKVTIPEIEGGQVQLLEQKKSSSAASDVIGAEEFSKSGDSTAAGALKRVTGLTVVGGKFVYVRGMGSRYSSSLLNGSTLPSPEPNKRVVPLDMFPTSVLEKVTVQKTYTPDMPGNFGGGTVRMETREYPEEFEFGLDLSVGGTTDTTLQQGLGYDGGSLDWLGVGDGTRALPDELAEATDGRALSKKDRFGRGNFTAEELETLGESLPNNWNTHERTVLPDLGVGADLGNTYDVDGAEVGFRLAGKYDYSHDTNVYEKKTYVASGDNIRLNNSYEFRETNDEVVTSVILAGGVEFNDDHTIELTSTLNRVTDDLTRSYEGFFSDHGDDIRVTRLQWIERQMMFHQLRGTHTFSDLNDLEFDWNYVYSQARRDEPDRREYRYDYEPQIEEFALSDRPSGNSRLWSDLTDHNHDGGIELELPFEVWNDLEATAKVGGDARRKDREVHTRRFKFFQDSVDLETFSQDPEGVFAADNIGSDDFFELRETTRSTDNYTGGQTILAGYLMGEVPVVESVRVQGGARLEHSRQRVETFALFSDQKEVGTLHTTDVLPALNARWEFAEEMQLRAGASRTVNRPNLRELSNARFTEVVGGREFQGNPDVGRALLTHYDARWEWYPDRGEDVSVGAFYKDFEDPIELTFEPGATPIVRPTNVQGARNFGVEFQGRTNLDFVSDALRDLYVAGNLSLIDSQVRVDPNSEDAEILTTTERPLQGQSPYVINGRISYDNPDIETTATVLYNVYGPRIAEVGIYGIPNVVEQPFHTLDVTFVRALGNGFEMEATAGNLLNLPRRFTQGGEPTRIEREGRSISLGLSWSPE